jgi:hypothetical protein
MHQTDAKAAANRANAQKSTGPRSAAGKMRVRRNALTHGLYAETAPDAGEDRVAFEHLHEDLQGRFEPEGPAECALVARLAALMWRLSRVPAAEHAVYAAHEHDFVPANDADDDGDGEIAVDLPELWAAAHCAGAIDSAIARLNRHEAHLQRMVTRTLDQLTLLQGLRTGADEAVAARAAARAQAKAPRRQPWQDHPLMADLDSLSDEEITQELVNGLNELQKLVAPEERFTASEVPAPGGDGTTYVRFHAPGLKNGGKT